MMEQVWKGFCLMFTHVYRGCFIFGHCDKPECKIQAFGVSPNKEYRSYRAAQLAIARAIKMHDSAMESLR